MKKYILNTVHILIYNLLYYTHAVMYVLYLFIFSNLVVVVDRISNRPVYLK